MRIGILSDARFPTRIDYAGHGLGRSVARLGKALARRGHQVTVYALPGSQIEGCTLYPTTDEGDLLAEMVWTNRLLYDVVIDSSHFFKPALRLQAEGYPVVSKVCDREYPGIPPNAVCGTSHHARQHGDPGGIVIPEGLDVDDVPFNPNPRQRFLVWAALKVAWKQPEWAADVAARMALPLLMIGDGKAEMGYYSCAIDLPALPPAVFYQIAGQAYALVSAVPSMGMLEAAAAGTPSIAQIADEFIEPGLTGVIWDGQHPYLGLPQGRQRMRDWVAAMRSADGMARDFEAVCERAMKGERW